MAYSITDECIGCGLCAKNCPVEAISGELKEQHVIDAQLCINCGVCGRLCAKSGILTNEGCIAVRVPKKEWPKPKIDTDICVACEICVFDCFKDCLELSRPTFVGDIKAFVVLAKEKACVSCGICVDSCNLGAITLCAPEPVQTKDAPGSQSQDAA